MNSPDVLVVGGGVVGLATARELRLAGITVAVVEAEFAGAGSTGAAMGHVVVMDDSPAQIAICRDARARWIAWFDGGGLPPAADHDPCGTLWLAANEAERQAAARKVGALQEAGIRAEWLDARALADAEPALRRGLVGAMRVPDDLVCYPPAIARALADELIAQGVRWIDRRVVGLEPGAARLNDGTRVAAGAIVLAGGAQTAALVPGLPLVPRRGHLVITDRTPVRVRHQLIELGYLDTAHSLGGASIAFNVQPRRTGQLLIGSSRELVGFDPAINRELVGRMLSRAVAFVPGIARVPASRTWIGFRPATPDALPLIGPWPALPGTWIATGHEGLGITMAPTTAALISAGITGKEPPIDPAPYLPDRVMSTHADAT
ncbi:MAG TPA: FAD-dependent oxidoreductase [Gemmatimonadales bacterium]|nr:FAD-dependent oxidoreductase [Gemmatimonadales bacterium]